MNCRVARWSFLPWLLSRSAQQNFWKCQKVITNNIDRSSCDKTRPKFILQERKRQFPWSWRKGAALISDTVWCSTHCHFFSGSRWWYGGLFFDSHHYGADRGCLLHSFRCCKPTHQLPLLEHITGVSTHVFDSCITIGLVDFLFNKRFDHCMLPNICLLQTFSCWNMTTWWRPVMLC